MHRGRWRSLSIANAGETAGVSAAAVLARYARFVQSRAGLAGNLASAVGITDAQTVAVSNAVSSFIARLPKVYHARISAATSSAGLSRVAAVLARLARFVQSRAGLAGNLASAVGITAGHTEAVSNAVGSFIARLPQVYHARHFAIAELFADVSWIAAFLARPLNGARFV